MTLTIAQASKWLSPKRAGGGDRASDVTPARPVRARSRGRPRASPGKRGVSVTPQSQNAPLGETRRQNAPFREAASSECAFPSRRGAREVWGDPPARLRGTMENASTGQMCSSNPPPACGAGCAGVRRSRFGVGPHGKAHSARRTSRKTALCDRASRKGAVCVATRTQSALFGETRIQNALFREATPRLPR